MGGLAWLLVDLLCTCVCMCARLPFKAACSMHISLAPRSSLLTSYFRARYRRSRGVLLAAAAVAAAVVVAGLLSARPAGQIERRDAADYWSSK